MICKICDRDLEIPADAVLLKKRHGIALYLFPGTGGLVHEFKTQAKVDRVKIPSRSACTRWHKQLGVVAPRCKWCRMDANEAAKNLRPPQIPLPISKQKPVPTPEPPKAEQVEVLNNLPQQPELEKPLPIQVNSESEQPKTTMQAAFNRLNRKS